jgi:hypothetical protein
VTPRLSGVWLRLYQLAEALEARGQNHEERFRAVKEELLAMPPELQRQSLERLEVLGRLGVEVATHWKESQPD